MNVIPLRTSDPIPGLALPPGRWHGRIWVTDQALDEPETYRACAAEFARSGLWPVVIPHDERFAFNGEDWIDDRPFLDPAQHKIDSTDPAATLSTWWPEPCCDGSCIEPFDADFPGLARRSTARKDPIASAGNLGWIRSASGHYRLGLVRARRAADLPAELGWSGMLNSTQDVAAISAVLRSWEDRFGARLVTLGFDVLELAVAAPPTTIQRALQVAAEHRAFCSYNFTQQPGNLREFAKGLIDVRSWRFWWD